jgi:ABC-type branched-subunit amino acid transport system substrate-binding protein
MSKTSIRSWAARVGGAMVVGAAMLTALSPSPASASSSGIPSGPILVGGIYPLSGPYAAYGKSELQGEIGLIDHFNARGGILGHKLKFVSVNDQLDPTIATSDAQQLISQGVKLIVSVGTETEAPSDVPVFMRAHVPVIFYNPGDTWGDAKKWPYYYKTGFGTYPSALALVLDAKKNGTTKIGLASDNTGFGVEFANDVKSAAQKNRVTIVQEVSYPPQVVSLSTQMAQLKSAGANGVIIGGGGGFTQAFTAMNGMNWLPNVYSFASILQFPQFAGLQGTPLAKNATVNCSGFCLQPGQKVPQNYASLTSVVEAQTGTLQNPGVSVIFGNDCLEIYAYAVEHTHSVDGPTIKKFLDKNVRNKSFTMPQFKYTYTSTNHNGLSVPQPMASVQAGFGPQLNPYMAAGYKYKS